MGPLGIQEMLAIFVIALLLFGPKKLPELGRMLGKAVREFRRAKNELKSTFETHLSELEKEIDVEGGITSSTWYSGQSYPPHPYDERGPQESSYSSRSTSYDSFESHENGGSETPAIEGSESTTSAPDRNSLEHAPIAGTVPRSNGVQPPDFGAAE